jgi:hypothetical protein
MSNSRDVTLSDPPASNVAASELRAQELTLHAVVAGWIIAAIASSLLMLALFCAWRLVFASQLAPASAAVDAAPTPH